MAKEKKLGSEKQELVAVAKPGMESEAKTARMEITKATWGNEIIQLDESIEVPLADAGWFLSRFGIQRSGSTMPLYLEKYEVVEAKAKAGGKPSGAPAPAN